MKEKDIATAYAVVELYQECNGDKHLIDTTLLATREKAVAFLHERYDNARLWADSGSGEMASDFSEDGWYSVVDNDGCVKEGYMSERLPIR